MTAALLDFDSLRLIVLSDRVRGILFKPSVAKRQPGEDDKETLKRFVVNHGPCCPIHQSTLDSPDYWTDPALMSSAAPASSTEWRRLEIESRSRHAKWATRHGY